MKKVSLYIFLGMVTMIFLATSCKKDEENASVGFRMKAVDTGSAGLKSSEGASAPADILPLTWDTALIVVTRLEFEAEFEGVADTSGYDESYEVKLEWKGHRTIDLLAEPEVFAYIDLPDGVYDEIELKVKSEMEESSGDPNFYLSGLFASNLGDIRITLVVDRDFEIKTEVEDWVIDSGSGSVYEGVLEISLQQLFNGISATDLESATIINGRIVISDSSNSTLYEKILENLNTNMDCDHDGDGDHHGGGGNHDDDEDDD